MRSFRWDGPCDTPDPDGEHETRTPELVEAETRRLMWEHSGIKPRGFDTIRQRALLQVRIDQLLDEHAALVEIDVMTS